MRWALALELVLVREPGRASRAGPGAGACIVCTCRLSGLLSGGRKGLCIQDTLHTALYSVAAHIHVLIREYVNTNTYCPCRFKSPQGYGSVECCHAAMLLNMYSRRFLDMYTRVLRYVQGALMFGW